MILSCRISLGFNIESLLVKSILFFFLIILPAHLIADVFKWVDADGQVHYGDSPTSAEKAEDQKLDGIQEIPTVQPLSSSRVEKRKKLLEAMDEDRKLKKEEAEKEKKREIKIAKRCLQVKDNLKTYNRANYVYNLDKEGNRIALPSSARDKVIANLKKQIDVNCR